MQFCERIQEAFYAGESLDRERLDFLVRNLEFLINQEKKIEMLGRGDAMGKEEIVKEKEVPLQKIEPVKKEPDIKVKKDIVKYLVEGKNRGFSLNLLKKKLLEAKFSEDDIEDAIEHLNFHLEDDKKDFHLEPFLDESSQKIETHEKEPESHRKIASIGDLERIKKKIRERGKIFDNEKFNEKTGLS